MVKLFTHNIFKYHGMPQSIVSDRDPRITSLFWKALFENMGTTLKFSSSFHPQTDGQSEEANSTVLDLLKCYVSDHKATWKHYLPLAEYAYNNTVHTSTGKTPFEIVEGSKKVPPILQTKDKIFEANKYMQNTDEAYRKMKLALEKTQSKQKKAVDRHRRELVFSLGDWALLCFEMARLRKTKGKERLYFTTDAEYSGADAEDFLGHCVQVSWNAQIDYNTAQWEYYLPLVEFAYNTIHSSTGKVPFEIVEGARKHPPMVKVIDDVFEADKFVEDLDLAYQ
ncbi:hypothetical protein L7F22_010695 [Adiantum nelumboides]|nr:hypothetical protein [Adiantum nelumboides]